MTQLQIIEKQGNDAVKDLRLQKLRGGLPFMINSKELKAYQCYLEYPDGSIELVSKPAPIAGFSFFKGGEYKTRNIFAC